MKKNLSRSLYPGLSKSQHRANNEWFDLAHQVTNEGGHVTLSNIGVVLQRTATGWVKIKKENGNDRSTVS